MFFSAQIILSRTSRSLVKVIVIWYFTYTRVAPLGVRLLIYFFSPPDSDIRCQCLRIFFLRSALLTLPLNFEDPEAAVIFSESICLIRASQMEWGNLSTALLTGLYVISLIWQIIQRHWQINEGRFSLLVTGLILSFIPL